MDVPCLVLHLGRTKLPGRSSFFAEILSRLSRLFFSLGVSRGDISLFSEWGKEIMRGDELLILISAKRLRWRAVSWDRQARLNE
jgi:hypothetical protein